MSLLSSRCTPKSEHLGENSIVVIMAIACFGWGREEKEPQNRHRIK